MVNVLKIEVIEGHHFPTSNTDSGGKVRFKQNVYVHGGGAYPFECQINLEGANHALLPGMYTLGLAGYRAGKYGDLEINNWDVRENLIPYIEPVAKEQVRKIS